MSTIRPSYLFLSPNLSMYKFNNLWPTDANTSCPAQFYTTDDYFKRPCFKQNQLLTRTIQPQRLRESIIRGKRTGVQHAQPSKEAYWAPKQLPTSTRHWSLQFHCQWLRQLTLRARLGDFPQLELPLFGNDADTTLNLSRRDDLCTGEIDRRNFEQQS